MKRLAYAAGIVLLLVGIIGFFNDPVFGLFEVDTPHNLIHILTGIALLSLAETGTRTRRTGLLVLTAVYAVITILGLAMGEGQLLGLVDLNHADHWLHLGLTILFAGMAFASGGDERR